MNDHICPVCNGTGRKPAGDYGYKHVISSYDVATDTLASVSYTHLTLPTILRV